MSTLLVRPDHARALLVLAHGAGAGMRHPFMEDMARRLADRHVATFRYQFPYMDAGRRRTDPPDVAMAAVRDAIRRARDAEPDLPLFAGGKSFGGRMTSSAAAEGLIGPDDMQGLNMQGLNMQGLVFLGFPLHPAGRPGTARADHLDHVPHPMLFVQGTRDSLADLDLLRPVLQRVGPRASLHVVDGADHSFAVLKRSGRTGEESLAEVADVVARWVARWVEGLAAG